MNEFWSLEVNKGQIISKANSPKKQTKSTQDADHKLLSRFTDLYVICTHYSCFENMGHFLALKKTGLKEKRPDCLFFF